MICIYSCQNEKENLILDFYQSLNQSDFRKIQTLISDTIIVGEMDWDKKYSTADYYDWFSWDSVFQPSYHIIDFEVTDSFVIFSVVKFCKRIDFLLGDSLRYTSTAKIKDKKINEIRTISYQNMDFKKWQDSRDSLIQWINLNHPDLKNFMDKQDAEFGKKFMKAISLHNEYFGNE